MSYEPGHTQRWSERLYIEKNAHHVRSVQNAIIGNIMAYSKLFQQSNYTTNHKK